MSDKFDKGKLPQEAIETTSERTRGQTTNKSQKDSEETPLIQRAAGSESGKSKNSQSQSTESQDKGPGMLLMGVIIVSYMITSQVLTLVNKYMYAKYLFKSPLNLLLMQCLCNVFICNTFMLWKTFVNPDAFGGLAKLGFKVVTYKEAISGTKFSLGLIIGIMNMIGVLFGLYAAKFCNIPLLLTNRRCMILATILMQMCLQGIFPDGKLCFIVSLMVAGAIVAGYESLDANGIGYIYVWMTNFTQAFQNVFTSKYNSQKQVAAFEINFYFACLGLPIMLFLTLNKGDFWDLYNVISAGEQTGLIALLFISGSFGFIITMNVLLMVIICGPIALNVTGTFKDLILTFVGIAIFNDQKLTPSFIVGISLSFTGAGIFTYTKVTAIQEKERKDKEQALAQEKAEQEEVVHAKLPSYPTPLPVTQR